MSPRATFIDRATGLRIEYPAGWEHRPSADFVLLIVPPGEKPEGASISVDIPALPPHVPGWIPIGMVRNGYVDDLRKAHPGAVVRDLTPPEIPGAKTRLVRSEWPDGTGARQETALMIVRGDHVYIIRASSRVEDEPDLRRQFDQIVRSVAWTR